MNVVVDKARLLIITKLLLQVNICVILLRNYSFTMAPPSKRRSHLNNLKEKQSIEASEQGNG